ncbi:enoyl-CoA hydratase/isomerase family protein [Mycolicibacterium sp. 018/SC-01/001]|uniref:enoyl-CoA hydratase/isomerase family protein n=1 Tax=Mycolicibacterium sp. 018/SC-01/001 TaxID=2592069 RepID=UPI0011810081|nr:enoyl-CoA hydratase-related protein [Mycolicibacterium sp. 018/SC-01/001]TRW79618.1 enoyl-CoA hydratase/isomerase family protein [Mycolicibacterium sp. 018/SC-01/001]
MTPGLTVRDENGVRWLIFDRPDAGNSITRAMQKELIERLADASADPQVRVVVLTATGTRHFCTGPDLRNPAMAPSRDRIAGDAARILRNGSQAVVTALMDCDKPVICALNGTAAGVGASMAMACDLIIAADTARFLILFVRRGLAPDGGAAYLLARKLPFNVAKMLLLFGGELPAQEAHSLGLVNRVVAADQLTAETAEWAARLAAGPTRAIAAAKAMMNQSLDVDRAAALVTEALLVEQVAGTDDVAEGIEAFAEKREARFHGR